ncbi:MAG: response regulator [Rhodospirillales bacterium]|nr:response regulator [Rhodospirillales bacterium]
MHNALQEIPDSHNHGAGDARKSGLYLSRDANKSYNLERLNFLVVDDNRHMRLIVKSILYSFGVRSVVEAEDGADAFRELRTYSADIVICDWKMEPLDGIDFTRMVRTASDSPNPFVPIVMLTGNTEQRRVVEARDAGVTEFLAKPISAKSLYSRIAGIIEHPRPFIRAKHYFGPDRRRKQTKFHCTDRRQHKNMGTG